MASTRPSSRYASMDSVSSTSSPSPSPSDRKHPSKNLSSLKRLISNSNGRRTPSDPVAAMDDSSRALAKIRSGDLAAGKAKTGQNFGSMMRKFMEKRSNLKPGSADRTALVVPADLIAEDLKKAAKGSNFSALHRKLFQKGGSADRTAGKALTEVNSNTRTLAMVLRSERELLSQNKEYEAEIMELRLLIEEKNLEVEKLKNLCLKQREEIKALKDAILFPDVMNFQLQELLEKQGSELKQAKQVIPSLQRQVTSLTGQIQWLAEDLAEVKADKYAVRTCFDGPISSPRTPIFDQETSNSLDYSSAELVTSDHGSPDEMFLKDFNPCLTPCFSKSKSKEYNAMLGYESPDEDRSAMNKTLLIPDMFSSSRSGILSKSSEHCQRPNLVGSTAKKIYRSDENKWSTTKPTSQNLF
ncbi:uncharacterized protein LOC103700870 isoform X2 [Phoenix dactylifera]|uniref:Uncharacterized protein LOC103700870 isoform X2 n=1 Tax=Phoenix dactylifera TaxID=42345 RepID=A0A8B7BLG5_PHODC|nr:uncharacterized protein LOC103700870 isoform X2 [Phoenix dactylifera]